MKAVGVPRSGWVTKSAVCLPPDLPSRSSNYIRCFCLFVCFLFSHLDHKVLSLAYTTSADSRHLHRSALLSKTKPWRKNLKVWLRVWCSLTRGVHVVINSTSNLVCSWQGCLWETGELSWSERVRYTVEIRRKQKSTWSKPTVDLVLSFNPLQLGC